MSNRGPLLAIALLLVIAIPVGMWFLMRSAREAAMHQAAPVGAPIEAPAPVAAPPPVAAVVPSRPLAPIVATIDRIDTTTGHDRVVVRSGGVSAFVPAGTRVRDEDHVTTDREQSARLTLDDGSVVIIGPSSDLLVEVVLAIDGRTSLGLLAGALHAVVNKIYSFDKPFTVASQRAVLGVRGTEFIAKTDGTGGLQVATLKGSVVLARNSGDLANPARSVTIAAGTTAQILAGLSAPTKPQAFESKVLFESLAKTSPLFVQAIQSKAAAPTAAATPGR